eukprot:3907407-Pyramimonas_sp.AAC.1
MHVDAPAADRSWQDARQTSAAAIASCCLSNARCSFVVGPIFYANFFGHVGAPCLLKFFAEVSSAGDFGDST